MSEFNPYAASAEIAPEPLPAYDRQSVSPVVVSHLSAAKPWIQFVGIIGYIASGIAFLMALGMVFSITTFKRMQDSMEFHDSYSTPPIVMLAVMTIGCLLAGILGIVFSTKLVRYASAISRLQYSGQTDNLEKTMDRNRRCWKFAGILTILGLIGFIILIGFSIWSQRETQRRLRAVSSSEQGWTDYDNKQ
jgi:NADH:ubiquinone oxidoreductase subunit 5 (subunit L)/multisubunit Na+/H+ antiporter MnhA subunit